MKYLTKEWYLSYMLSCANGFTRKSKKAEKLDEKFYQRVYRNRCEQYVAMERTNDFYRDPQEDLRKIDDYINATNITEQERARRQEFKEDFIYLNKERIEKNIFYEFDEKTEEYNFGVRVQQNIELFQHLPQSILDKIADLRMFALGYASAEVKRLLKPYCAELRRTCAKIKKKAFADTDTAETYLSDILNVNEYEELILMGYEYKDNDLYLYFDDDGKLLIKNGKIIEGEEHNINPYDSQIPHCAWSRVRAAELHRVENKFEIHFLISDLDESEKCELWYLTAVGTDIQEIVSQQK